jgi:hypothetical protein
MAEVGDPWETTGPLNNHRRQVENLTLPSVYDTTVENISLRLVYDTTKCAI